VGGKDPLTTDEIKKYGVKSYRTQDRSVTTLDHKDLLLANYNEFLLDVKILNSDKYFEISGETPEISGKYYNNLYVYVLPVYEDYVTVALKLKILEFLEDYKISTLNYIFKDIDYRLFDVNITYKRDKDTVKTVTELNTNLNSSIIDYFKRTNRVIGEELKYSEILKQLHDLDGLSSVTLALSSDLNDDWQYQNIKLNNFQFPKLNNVTIASLGKEE